MHIIIECPLAYVPGIDAGQTEGIGVEKASDTPGHSF